PLVRARGAVAATGGSPARVTASHGRAVERRVEGVLVELQPASQGPAGASAPGPLLESLDHARRLAQQVRPLAPVALDDRPRPDRVAGLEAQAARPVRALKRPDRASWSRGGTCAHRRLRQWPVRAR